MNDAKTYYRFLGILAVIALLVYWSPTIFPVMDDDEYFVDKNGFIHGNDCPLKDVPWFTIKHSKYNILIMDEQEVCRDCLLFEEDKLYLLHRHNLNEEIVRLRGVGATEEYISNKLNKYKSK